MAERRPGRSRREDATLLAASIGILVLPMLLSTDYDVERLRLLLLSMLPAIGLNLAMGYGGQFALGQVAIMAASAYGAGMLAVHRDWTMTQTFLPAVVAGALTSLVVHLPGLRLRGWTLAVTGFLAVITVAPLLDIAKRWTGGQDGIIGVGAPVLFGQQLDAVALCQVVAVAVVLVFVASRSLVRSSWGLRVMALRDAPLAAQGVGQSLPRLKLALYVVSGVPAGMAGWLFVHAQSYAAPSQFGFTDLVILLASVVVGGRGTLWGPILGTAVVRGISLVIGPFSIWNQLAFGLAILVVVLGAPNGLVPAIRSIAARLGWRAPRRGLEERPADVPTTAGRRGGSSLEVRDLAVGFGGVTVLQGVSFDVPAGAIVGLLGPNGSGKTTVVNCISGFVVPDAGQVSLDGEPLRGRPAGIARAGIGRTYQIPNLVPELPVLENIELGAVGQQRSSVVRSLLRTPDARRSRRDSRTAAIAAAREMDLPDALLHEDVAAVSLGMKRVVEIARAVAGMPQLLILDEPAAGLNREELDRLEHALRLLRRHATVLLIEHNVDFVQRVCDEIVLLDEGVVVARADLRTSEPLPDPLVEFIELYPADEQQATALVVGGTGVR